MIELILIFNSRQTKRFNIADDCGARYIELIIPPGKCSQNQILPKEVKKTNIIVKLRILVEQVIRQLKIFKILAHEVSISVIPQLAGTVIVCFAMTNLRKPIYC